MHRTGSCKMLVKFCAMGENTFSFSLRDLLLGEGFFSLVACSHPIELLLEMDPLGESVPWSTYSLQ